MTGLVDAIGERVSGDCLVASMNKDNCDVGLKNVPERHLIVDFDKPGSPLGTREIRCDYLFAAEGDDTPDWIVPVECKSGRREKPGHAVRQLQAGATAADALIPAGCDVRFRPVLVARGGKFVRRHLSRPESRITYRGRRYGIRLIPCGAPLTTALAG